MASIGNLFKVGLEFPFYKRSPELQTKLSLLNGLTKKFIFGSERFLLPGCFQSLTPSIQQGEHEIDRDPQHLHSSANSRSSGFISPESFWSRRNPTPMVLSATRCSFAISSLDCVNTRTDLLAVLFMWLIYSHSLQVLK